MSINDMEDRKPGTISSVIDRTPIWVIWMLVFLLAGSFVYNSVAVSSVESRNQEARTLIREAQIASCERVNELRVSHNAQADAIRRVLATAAASNLSQGNESVAAEYNNLAGSFHEIPITDCEEAFPESISTAGVGGPDG